LENFPLKALNFHGYLPGTVGKITEAHALYYYEHWGFDRSFETQVGGELSEFMNDFQEQRDGLWVATIGDSFAGSIAMDGREAPAKGVRLRWFLVLPEFQGRGIGKALMEQALEFSLNRGYTEIYLWTFKGLDVARSIYERQGFRLCLEQQVNQWGQHLTEQMFMMNMESS